MVFAPPFNLRPQDIGKLTVSAVAGGILLPLLVWAYRTGSSSFRKAAEDLLLLVLAFVFFGVFVDLAHQAVKLNWAVDFAVGLLEDGGEMVVMSVIVWYVFLLSLHRGDVRSQLRDLYV